MASCTETRSKVATPFCHNEETQPQIHLVMVEMENKYQSMEPQPTTQVVVAVVIMVLPTEVKVVSVVVEM